MFVNKLAQCAFGISACMLNSFALAAEAETHSIRELKNDDEVTEIAAEFDFTVISFYNPSDAASVEVDSYMEGAQKHFYE